MKTLPTLFATLFVGAVAVAGGATTHAASSIDSQIRQEIVTFEDLDLSRSEDAEVLYHRIRTAARDVCGARGLVPLSTAVLIRACAEDATQRALMDVNAPTLSVYQVTIRR